MISGFLEQVQSLAKGSHNTKALEALKWVPYAKDFSIRNV